MRSVNCRQLCRDLPWFSPGQAPCVTFCCQLQALRDKNYPPWIGARVLVCFDKGKWYGGKIERIIEGKVSWAASILKIAASVPIRPTCGFS